MKKAFETSENNSAILFEGGPAFQAPGHCSVIVDDSDGHWMLYHAFVGPEREKRVLMIDRVVYKDGFPWVGSPSNRSMLAPEIHLTQ